ncbi:MAG TPA: RNA methyltransferase [bacterium]|nr:RNA methyltransferase [bacterium]
MERTLEASPMHDEEIRDTLVVVLCRVEGAMNVGAACRAIKTMGFSRLVLADCPQHDETEVRTHALHAFDVYEAAARYGTLSAALEPHALVAGFTRRTGQRRKDNVSVDAFARSIATRAGGSVALVFGNERDGLSDPELALCDVAVSIPTSPLFPSLNLSHAVQIACWEARKVLASADGYAEARLPVSRARIDSVSRDIVAALQSAGMFKMAGRPEAESFVRSVVARAGLSQAELERFAELFYTVSGIAAAHLDRTDP